MLSPILDLQGKEQPAFLSTTSREMIESEKVLVWKAP